MKAFKSSSKQGLTLIEVILAASILSIGMIVLLVSASRCIAVMKVSKKYQTAQWVLGMGEVKYPMMLEAIEDIEDLDVSPDSDILEGYTFSRVVEDEDADDEDNLYVIRSRVSWADRGKKPYHEVAQYVWYPEGYQRCTG